MALNKNNVIPLNRTKKLPFSKEANIFGEYTMYEQELNTRMQQSPSEKADAKHGIDSNAAIVCHLVDMAMESPPRSSHGENPFSTWGCYPLISLHMVRKVSVGSNGSVGEWCLLNCY